MGIWLEKIKDKFQVGLLTNMYPGMFEAIQKRKIMPKIDWKVIVDSSKVRLKKPEIEIYQLAEKLAKTKPEEILFIDNKKKNLESAQKLGWQTFWYDSANYEQSSAELEKYLG